jgi:hypothetical protein
VRKLFKGPFTVALIVIIQKIEVVLIKKKIVRLLKNGFCESLG